jgi:O-6-methylguanine DNA methyltransferase
MKTECFELPIPTRDGRFTARYSEKGVAALDFPKVGTPRCGVRSAQRADPTNKIPAKIRGWHRATISALKNVLAGRKSKSLPPLDLSSGTTFQKSVWQALRKISTGKTKSYGEIARAIGKPKAVRAVGGACGANPIPVLVPCHRILAANKKLGGFSGGLDWKRELLKREGVILYHP